MKIGQGREGKPLERLEPLKRLERTAALIRTLNCFFKRFELSVAVERFERFEPASA